MNRVPIRGTTVRDYREEVQVALFGEDNKYFAVVLLSKKEARKLGFKLLRKSGAA